MPNVLPNTHTLATTQTRFSKRGSWLLAVLVLAVLSLFAWLAQTSVDRSARQQMEGYLLGVLAAKSEALETWLAAARNQARLSVQTSRANQLLLDLLRRQDQERESVSPGIDGNEELNSILTSTATSLGGVAYFVANRMGEFVLSSPSIRLGDSLPSDYNAFMAKLLQANTVVVPPHALSTMQNSAIVGTQPDIYPPSTMLLCILVPISQNDQDTNGLVGFLLRSDGDFSRLLNSGSEHSQISSYAVDSNALMLSVPEAATEAANSQAGGSRSRTLLVRDPGMNLTNGAQSQVPPAACPMTVAAAGLAAAASNSERKSYSSLSSYRDYRGIDVVGAWRWLPEYQMGVVTEIPSRVAFSHVRFLGYGLWGSVGLLAVSSGAVLFFARLAQAVLKRLGRAEKKLAKLGQYELIEKIGQGGMGEVFRARHALLRRETAVKICQTGPENSSANHRFQREVQAASQLNNAHTVRIFDYGQAENGRFFYAMELLHGVNLTGLIRQFGALTDGRTIYLLKQICESLAEAHGLGLVHRDVKPSNVMIGRRGGVADFVKVLDFGLVRSFGANRTVSLTLDGCIAGTPHYMSPEASQNPQQVDPRSDLYSLGCLAFHLLCGSPPFKGTNPLEICLKQVREPPPRIESLCANPICEELSEIVMGCIAKSPEERPQSALELIGDLEKAIPLNPWTREDAELWWRNNAEVAQSIMVSGPDTQASMDTRTPS